VWLFNSILSFVVGLDLRQILNILPDILNETVSLRLFWEQSWYIMAYEFRNNEISYGQIFQTLISVLDVVLQIVHFRLDLFPYLIKVCFSVEICDKWL